MLTVPTDSINKFLAIGSLVSMVLLFDICLKNYEKAEIAYISAYVKAEEFRTQYTKYSSHVNEGLRIHNNAIRNNKILSNLEREEILTKMNKASSMDKEMEKISLESLELAQKGILYQRLKYIWIFITVIVFILCSFTAFIGFRNWYLSEKRHPIN